MDPIIITGLVILGIMTFNSRGSHPIEAKHKYEAPKVETRGRTAEAGRCDPTHSSQRPALYLGSTEVRMDGDLRDVRTNPEPPALWPDEPSNLVLSLLLPSNSLLLLSRRERA